MNWRQKFFSLPWFQKIVLWYLRKPRRYCYQKICLTVFPEVFHPGFFFSTRTLLKFLEKQNLQRKTLLELGAGSGLISFYSEKKGALVYASDSSVSAIEGLKWNKQKLSSSLTIIESDLFDFIPHSSFDFIVINPPYYQKPVREGWQQAWHAGERFEYFEKLFSQLPLRITNQTSCLMVLSEYCNLPAIQQIAERRGMQLKQIERRRTGWEWNSIFEITKRN